MKFEEPELVPTTGNTVAYRETLFVESSSAYGSGPFWTTFLDAARVFGLDPTVHQHEYVRVHSFPQHSHQKSKCISKAYLDSISLKANVCVLRRLYMV